MNSNRLYDNDPTLWSNLMRAYYSLYVDCYHHRGFPVSYLSDLTFMCEDSRSQSDYEECDDPTRPYLLYFVRPRKVYGRKYELHYSPLEQQLINELPSHGQLVSFCVYLSDAPLHYGYREEKDLRDVECWSDFVDYVVDNCIDDPDELEDCLRKGGVDL